MAIEAKMKKEDIYWGAMLGITEMIKSGTTTFADMYGDMDQVAQACIDTDIRAVLSRGIIGVAPNGNQALEENKILFRDFNNANNGKNNSYVWPSCTIYLSARFSTKSSES